MPPAPPVAARPTTIVIHYGEVGIKGKNRPFFLGMLKRVLQRSIEGAPVRKLRSLPGRLLLECARPLSADEEARVLERIGGVFGVAHFSVCAEVARDDLDGLEAAVVELASRMQTQRPRRSFRIVTHRSDKRFPITSVDLNVRLGQAVVDATGLCVDLKSPEMEVHVEVLQDRFLLYGDRRPGLDGLPVGSSGRLVALLSSGIDSPVAAYRLMGRGCRIFFVHFHSLPYTKRASLDLAEELVRQLARHQPSSRLYLVPLAEIQRKIVTEAPAPLRVVLYRRYMLRLAALVAKKVHARALVTGESLAQVASQTLDNLVAIEEAVDTPILRPLIGTSKGEIIAEARRLGTFDISIQPFDDCCSFLMPQSPETHAKLDQVLRAEERLGEMQPMLFDALARTEELRIKLPPLS
ncbi:MAG: tRNA uracil 4-sulfurtransferase ThiI [Candidatus Eisenbacteria bacterium]